MKLLWQSKRLERRDDKKKVALKNAIKKHGLGNVYSTVVTLKFKLQFFLESRDAPKPSKTQTWRNFGCNESFSCIFLCLIRVDPQIFIFRGGVSKTT